MYRHYFSINYTNKSLPWRTFNLRGPIIIKNLALKIENDIPLNIYRGKIDFKFVPCILQEKVDDFFFKHACVVHISVHPSGL